MVVKNNNCKIEKWGYFEIGHHGTTEGNPFIDVTFTVEFTHRNRTITVDGFYDGEGYYRARFMPDREGEWKYITRSNCTEIDKKEGSFLCAAPSEGNHGPVRIRDVRHFIYEDGTAYYPIGTTCYSWTHQGDELEQITLSTLETSPYNKLRMCVFPINYDFCRNEPVYYPFKRLEDGTWDFTCFSSVFFRHLEQRIVDLMKLGIEADVILFHPYDHERWGFDSMEREVDDRYIKYTVARLSAYRNVWWSLANENSFMKSKTEADWDRFFKIVQESDPYQHLRSIHNGSVWYDYKKLWVTHCSIQSDDVEKTPEWNRLYKKPVIVDECKYEGNISHIWGNIPPEEMVRRIWEGIVRSGYVGHGETYMNPEDILWFGRGGRLFGKSTERITFLKKILEEAPVHGINRVMERFSPYAPFDDNYGGTDGEYYLLYLGISQPLCRELILPEDRKFKIDIIDTWEMAIKEVKGVFSGKCTVSLPGKSYIALRVQRIYE